jgi:[ribosomal protein S5]-alanine N-acetyltransferase
MPLEGQLVIIREQKRDDLPFLMSLQNDPQTQAWSLALPPDFTDEMYEKRYEAREFSYDPDEARFVIVHRESGELVGQIQYNSLERRWSATMGIITATKFWGTGVALDAQEVLLRFLFCELGVRVVRIFTHSGIPRAGRLAEKSGFRVSGRMRQAIIKYGGLHDNLVMDLLREEYFVRHPELTDTLPAL